jgi:hypothetical protein
MRDIPLFSDFQRRQQTKALAEKLSMEAKRSWYMVLSEGFVDLKPSE